MLSSRACRMGAIPSAPLVLRSSDSGWVTPLPFLGAQLADGRSWDLSAVIIVRASCLCKEMYITMVLVLFLWNALTCQHSMYDACGWEGPGMQLCTLQTSLHVHYLPYLLSIHLEKEGNIIIFLNISRVYGSISQLLVSWTVLRNWDEETRPAADKPGFSVPFISETEPLLATFPLPQ